MKYVKKWILILPIISLMLWGVSSCMDSPAEEPGGTKDACEHTYSDKWEYNEKEHFHRATCEHRDLTKDNQLHQFTVWKNSNNGKTEERECEVCGYIETRSKVEVPHQHTYGSWSIVEAPTIDTKGLIKRVCSQDESHIEEFELPKLNGQIYAYRVEVPATCSSKGEASYTYDLGDQKLQFTVELDYASHNYGKWEMIKAPTLTTTGLLERVCSSNQNHKDSFELPKLNAKDYDYSVIPAECFADGKEIYNYQKDQQNFKIELPIVSTGHPYELKQDGDKHWLESNCEHHLKKEIQDHEYVDGVCSVCNHEQKEDNAVVYELNLSEDGYIASINPNYEGSSITILDTYLDLPVVELKKSSFDGKNIVFITLPSSIQKIEADVFAGFEQLECVFYDGSILDWCGIIFSSKTSNPMHLAKSFYQRGKIFWEETTNIEVPSEVTQIGKYQFYGFEQIEEITLPSTLEIVSEGAFGECSKMTEFTIPSSVTFIGKDALIHTRLTKLSLPFLSASTKEESYLGYYFGVRYRYFDTGCWYHDKEEALISLEELTLTKEIMLYDYSLSNLPNLKKLTLPNTLTELGTRSIYGCIALEFNEFENGYYLGNDENPYLLFVKMIDETATTFTLASQTKLIYEDAFKNALFTEIEIPSTVIEIGNEAFSGSALTSIELPDSITHLNAHTFSNCQALEEVILPMNLTTIDQTAFLENKIKKATLNLFSALKILTSTIEDLTISAGEGTINLASYPALKRVQLTSGITDIGKDVVASCPNLEYTIENRVAYLGNEENPYVWCMYAIDKTIEDIDLPYDTHYIYENAFKDCIELIGVRIPDRVLKIEESAFYNCKKLSFVYFGGSLAHIETIETKAFALCNALTSISFPKSLTYLGEAVLGGCIRIARLTLPFVGATPNPSSASRSTLFSWIFGSINNKDGELSMVSITQQYGPSSSKYYNYIPVKLQEVNILGGKILYGAFSGFSGTVPNVNIDTFTLTKDVDVRSNITGGLRPKYLTTPFENLSRFDTTEVLELTLTTPGEAFSLNGSKYYYIQKITFAGIKTITHSNYYVSTLTNVALPNDLEEIGANVFRSSTGLASLILPKSLKKIGANAFESTTILYYLGTEEEWNLIEKEPISSPIYFYSETMIENGWHYVDDIPTLW